ncbi:hypothetical protein [Adhaeribacter pallidiroseus]|uniref:Uncharacterized protein n=1 Tax=Adhaeribacter pallidiroseus TaxID=2072847 RepID=A0A369QKZ3_9BACT|nr:hypothetical protein [Adhaeribacter pallidiroseus]RDC65052.1 hypothetical protein AHMF7616_03675 [Adhaeribacter pallidiroseus]
MNSPSLANNNSKEDNSMFKEIEPGLKATETLISLLCKLFDVIIPDFKGCADDLQEVCNKILEANKNVVKWINKFRDFDLSDSKYKNKFSNLVGEYRELKTGKGYQTLKFDCRQIERIYNERIGRNKLKELFSEDKLELAALAFEELSAADAVLVEFVHKEVFESLDEVCTSMETAINEGNLKAANIAQMKFKVISFPVYSRLQEIGNGLSDLVIKFHDLADRKSTHITYNNS